MAEYIERKALLNALKEEHKKGNFVFTSKWIKEIMDNLPPTDVVPRADYDNLKIEVDAMRGAANSYKMHYERLAREIFEEIYEDCFDQYGYIDYEALDELKKKHTGDQK